MKKYSIGDVLNEVELGRVAFDLNGGTKGATLVVDPNSHRLIMKLANGEITEAIYISHNPNEPKEAGKVWVFIDELTEDDKEVMLEYLKVQRTHLENEIDTLKEAISLEKFEPVAPYIPEDETVDEDLDDLYKL